MDQAGLIAAGIAVFLIAAYIDALNHPLTKCWRCGGKGRIRAVILFWRYRACWKCKGSGEIRGRFGGKK